jgi:26S proteasome regulatory subunit T6
MDEIDSIGGTRIESSRGGDSEVQRTMLELLNQLDGFEPSQNIKVCLHLTLLLGLVLCGVVLIACV